MKVRKHSKEVRWLLEEKYQGKITKAAQKDLARLRAGEPVDYLIGYVDFAGCRVDLSQHPLIPRPETEHWTLQAIHEIQNPPRRGRRFHCLDIFAGSGCIGIAVLKHIPQAHVHFAEQEKTFLQQIRLNLKKNRILKKRFHIFQSDIFSKITGKYDYIFANPPYVAESRRRTVQPSVLRHEPHGALFGGEDGLEYIKRFLKEAKNYLNPEGKVYLEFDTPQKREIEDILKGYKYSSWKFQKDQYGKWRFVIVQN